MDEKSWLSLFECFLKPCQVIDVKICSGISTPIYQTSYRTGNILYIYENFLVRKNLCVSFKFVLLTPKLEIEGHFFLNIFHSFNQHRIYKNKSPLADQKSAMNSIFRTAVIGMNNIRIQILFTHIFQYSHPLNMAEQFIKH